MSSRIYFLMLMLGTTMSSVSADSLEQVTHQSRFCALRDSITHHFQGAKLKLPLNLRGGFSIGGSLLGKPIERSLSADLKHLRPLSSAQLSQPGRIHTSSAQLASASSGKDEIERTIEIDATPEEVFQVAARFEQYPEWAGVTAIKILERGRDGLGKTVKLDCGMFGRSISYTLAYTFERPRHMRWFAIAGSLKELVGSYDFQPIGEGRTRVVYKLRVEPGFYLPSVIKSSTSAFVASAALSNLKRYSELPSTKLSLKSSPQAAACDAERVESTPIWALSTLL
jgi:ribosome-associated toxin RatA of RatAB toxin-antitoxin module